MAPDREHSLRLAREKLEHWEQDARLPDVRPVPDEEAPLIAQVASRVHRCREAPLGGGVDLLKVWALDRAWFALRCRVAGWLLVFSSSSNLSAVAMERDRRLRWVEDFQRRDWF